MIDRVDGVDGKVVIAARPRASGACTEIRQRLADWDSVRVLGLHTSAIATGVEATPSIRELTAGATRGSAAAARRAGCAAPDRGDPEPVAGGVLDQDRHELAGRVTVEPAIGVLYDAVHDSRVEHAELRGQSLHHMVNRGAFGTGGRHQLPA